MDKEEARKTINELSPRLTEARKAKIARVVEGRTKNLIPVVEDVHDVGNINACMRSAEAFGCLDFHIVSTTKDTKYIKGKRTSSGAMKWLNINKWSSIGEFIEYIKENKIQLVVTAFSENSVDINTVDFTQPTAIVFGNEHAGVSNEILEAADAIAHIPMSGFVESFNISVACALSLNIAQSNRGKKHQDMPEDEKLILTADYFKRSLPK